jgi:adenylate cyclase
VTRWGVLGLESRDPLAFDSWTETFLKVLANQIALGIARVSDAEDDGDAAPEVSPSAGETSNRPLRTFQFFRNDDCIFVDGEYLIRNVPAKILWKLLKAHTEKGREEFTNRELRLDPTLGLPALKDNLESRLILLRKRLEEKCGDIRLVPVRRGRFALQIRCPVKLEERESTA